MKTMICSFVLILSFSLLADKNIKISEYQKGDQESAKTYFLADYDK